MSAPQFLGGSCDTMVVLAPATAAGMTLFAKNSDRPPLEPQPVRQFSRERHAPGSRVRLQYLDIPQVEATAAMIGSQPTWLWGFEHGLNEHRVAIGNELVHTKQTPGEVGLLGMDLVRLGLERARTAEEALEVITTLIETHGQGGSGYAHMDVRYNNAFIICDPREAWVLDTNDRQWAARRTGETDSISNFISLGHDWERVSANARADAEARGWDAGGERFDFQGAYREADPGIYDGGETRQAQSAALLGDLRSHATPAHLRRVLRDHYAGAEVFQGSDPAEPEYYGICSHVDPLWGTTASMIAQLPADPARLPIYWLSMATPCTSAFLPVFPDGTIPEALGRAAGEEPGDDSPWWQYKRLQQACAANFPALTPKVQAIFAPWEAATDTAVEQVRTEAESLRAAGDDRAMHDLLTDFMRTSFAELQRLCAAAAEAVANAA